MTIERMKNMEDRQGRFSDALYNQENGLQCRMNIIWERYQRSKAIEIAIITTLILNFLVSVFALIHKG